LAFSKSFGKLKGDINMEEIIFTYNGERCHATIVDSPQGLYIGNINGFDIYNVSGSVIDQFGFIAKKSK